MFDSRAKFVSAMAIALTTALVIAACMSGGSDDEKAVPGGNYGADGSPVAYTEPVKLTSVDGILEVRLSAHQGTVELDTASKPVSDFMVSPLEAVPLMTS